MKYGDLKIPNKVLKSIEDKATKVAKGAAPPATTASAESKKRKGANVSKALVKRRKSVKAAKHKASEGSIAVPMSAEAATTHEDEDLMGSSLHDLGGTDGAANVALPPPVFSDGSLDSEEGDADEVLVFASGRNEVASSRLGRPTKTPRLEESEAESDERPPSACPSSPASTGVGVAAFAVGAMATGDTQNALFLRMWSLLVFLVPCCFSLYFSRFDFVLVVLGDLTKAIGDPMDPTGKDLARVGLEAPPKAPLLEKNPSPSCPAQALGEGCLCFFFSCICLGSIPILSEFSLMLDLCCRGFRQHNKWAGGVP